jgi:hypothetical protein
MVNNLVNKDKEIFLENKFIESSYSFSVEEQKVIRILASMIKKGDSEFKDILKIFQDSPYLGAFPSSLHDLILLTMFLIFSNVNSFEIKYLSMFLIIFCKNQIFYNYFSFAITGVNYSFDFSFRYSLSF